MRAMVSATGMFVYKEVISKLHIKLLLASDKVRRVLAKSYDFFRIYEFTVRCDMKGTRCFQRIKLNDPYAATIGRTGRLLLCTLERPYKITQL